jgi:2-hydroxycyclohexanecarboxyl-CoA dehydrogenase
MPESARKVAIVTGATRGLGRAIAVALGRRGVRVVVSGRDAAAGREVVGAIEGEGGAAVFVPADLERPADSEALARAALTEFGQIDIVVASAGLPPAAQGIFGTLDIVEVGRQVSRTIGVKLNPVQACVSHMVERRSGSILFVTSEGGSFPTPGQTTVALHSGGLIQAARVMAKELSRHRVRVNTLCVTIVEDTPTWSNFTQGGMTEQRQKIFGRIVEKAPFGVARPEDVAGVASFLVSDDATFITGATISATGGLT